MNRPDDPFYYNKANYKNVFPNHIHNEKGKPLDEDCGVCVQNDKIINKDKYDKREKLHSEVKKRIRNIGFRGF